MRVVDRLPPVKGGGNLSHDLPRSRRHSGTAMQRSTRKSHVARSSSSDLYAVLDLILDKGLVADVGLVKEDGSEANTVFRGTAEDLRRADKVLSPADPGMADRRRLEVAHYVLDVQV